MAVGFSDVTGRYLIVALSPDIGHSFRHEGYRHHQLSYALAPDVAGVRL
jgi:hypothetical protein